MGTDVCLFQASSVGLPHKRSTKGRLVSFCLGIKGQDKLEVSTSFDTIVDLFKRGGTYYLIHAQQHLSEQPDRDLVSPERGACRTLA